MLMVTIHADLIDTMTESINKAVFDHIANNQPKYNVDPLYTQGISLNRMSMNVEYNAVVCPNNQANGIFKTQPKPDDKTEMKKLFTEFNKIGKVNGAKLRTTGYALFVSPDADPEAQRECWTLVWSV
jgi:hypothetical protein